MTTAELIAEVKASLGNRTDIADARYVIWLNWAFYDMCGFHKKRIFRPKRFHQLEGDHGFTTTPVTGTAQAGSTSTTIILAATESAVTDFYEYEVIKITAGTGIGEVKNIIAYNGTTKVATVATAWTATPDATSVYAIYRRRWHLNDDIGIDPNERIWTVQQMQELVSGKTIEQEDWRDIINVKWSDIGEPGGFCRRGDYIVFNQTPDTAVTYRLWVYNFPTRLTEATPAVEPMVPDYWHEVIALGAIWRGFSKLMEPDRAAMAKTQYESAVINRLDSHQLEKRHISQGMKVRMH